MDELLGDLHKVRRWFAWFTCVPPSAELAVPLLVFIFINLGASTVWSGERLEFHNGVRALGMGGAALAVTNDETAMVVNPAGLGKLRDYIVTVFDPELHMSGPVTGLTSGQQITNYFDPQPIYDAIAKMPGLNFHFTYNLMPSVVAPNFGLGVLYHARANGRLDEAGTNFHYDYRSDVAPILAYNFRFWDGRIKLGVSGRYIERVEASFDSAPPISGLERASFQKASAGIGVDFGLMLSAPWKSLPTLALVVRDFGDTKFDIGGDPAKQVDTVAQTVDAAVAFFPIGGKRVRFTITAEMKDILSSSELDLMRRLHSGIEANFADILFLRAGYNQNYWTAGIEFATGHMQFQAATYGENIGTDTALVEDRRYVGKFVFRF